MSKVFLCSDRIKTRHYGALTLQFCCSFCDRSFMHKHSVMSWGPIFEKSCDELKKNLWKSLTCEKLRMSLWLSKKSYEKLRKNLWKTYDDIVILRKRNICSKWCRSGNSLSEAVVGSIFWAKNSWQPEWRFPKNAFEKWLTIFLRKS